MADRTRIAIRTVSPNKSRHWSSRDVAEHVFGHEIDLTNFTPHKPSYRLSSVIDAKTPQQVSYQDDDRMDIDDDPTPTPEALLPSHALDLLHIQVAQHFTRLLVELVGRVGEFTGGKQDDVKGTIRSIHAPRGAASAPRKDYAEWDASDCLEFLHLKRASPRSSPRVEVFLALPYTRRGARRGQDWSRRDWEVALDTLANIGDLWQEGYIRESLLGLKPIMDDVFRSRMRPTGI